jgi:hypothetical protein
MTHSPDYLKNWAEGLEHFNARRFWEAHESWERGWRALPAIEKLHVQALIQTAAIFDLIRRSRSGAALSVARLALDKLQMIRNQGGMDVTFPRLEIPGLEKALIDLCSLPEAEFAKKIPTLSLKARLLLSPP